MIKYYKLFDLLNRKGMKKTDLLKIMSSPTLAKLSKGEVVKTDIIDKICSFLSCQPSDIMEYISSYYVDTKEEQIKRYEKWLKDGKITKEDFQKLKNKAETTTLINVPTTQLEEYSEDEFEIITENLDRIIEGNIEEDK